MDVGLHLPAVYSGLLVWSTVPVLKLVRINSKSPSETKKKMHKPKRKCIGARETSFGAKLKWALMPLLFLTNL